MVNSKISYHFKECVKCHPEPLQSTPNHFCSQVILLPLPLSVPSPTRSNNHTCCKLTAAIYKLQPHPVRSMYCTCDLPCAFRLNVLWYTINIWTWSSPFFLLHPAPQLQNSNLLFVPQNANSHFTPQRKQIKLLMALIIINICSYRIWRKFTNRMIRIITVLNCLFNHFFHGRYFLSFFCLEFMLRTFLRTLVFIKLQVIPHVRKQYSYWPTWQNQIIYTLSCT
jgi:hypothetical protein